MPNPINSKTATVKSNVTSLEVFTQPIVSFSRDLQPREEIEFHTHDRDQLVYASQGVMTVRTKNAAYVIPSQRAVWMPAEISHAVLANDAVSMRSLYIETARLTSMPKEPTVLQISPLLRELIMSAVAGGNDYDQNSRQYRLGQVVLDEISHQAKAHLSLPLPRDPRLIKITQALLVSPGDNRTLDQWSSTIGASKRTINRLFTKQTGMTFQGWRQQLRLLRAMEVLAEGKSVNATAEEMGYETPSAFVAMFKRAVGSSPKSYINGLAGSSISKP